MYLAQMVPFTLNVKSVCEKISVTRNQLIKMMTLLERASLIRQLRSDTKSLKAVGKPEKILFDNPNVMHALCSTVDVGTQRETFLSMAMEQAHHLLLPSQGDLLVDDKYLFEIGGKNKGFGQIRNLDDSFVVSDDIEVGFGNKIPLWMFGFLY